MINKKLGGGGQLYNDWACGFDFTAFRSCTGYVKSHIVWEETSIGHCDSFKIGLMKAPLIVKWNLLEQWRRAFDICFEILIKNLHSLNDEPQISQALLVMFIQSPTFMIEEGLLYFLTASTIIIIRLKVLESESTGPDMISL